MKKLFLLITLAILPVTIDGAQTKPKPSISEIELSWKRLNILAGVGERMFMELPYNRAIVDKNMQHWHSFPPHVQEALKPFYEPYIPKNIIGQMIVTLVEPPPPKLSHYETIALLGWCQAPNNAAEQAAAKAHATIAATPASAAAAAANAAAAASPIYSSSSSSSAPAASAAAAANACNPTPAIITPEKGKFAKK